MVLFPRPKSPSECLSRLYPVERNLLLTPEMLAKVLLDLILDLQILHLSLGGPGCLIVRAGNNRERSDSGMIELNLVAGDTISETLEPPQLAPMAHP